MKEKIVVKSIRDVTELIISSGSIEIRGHRYVPINFMCEENMASAAEICAALVECGYLFFLTVEQDGEEEDWICRPDQLLSGEHWLLKNK
jgi:hypothetical protein